MIIVQVCFSVTNEDINIRWQKEESGSGYKPVVLVWSRDESEDELDGCDEENEEVRPADEGVGDDGFHQSGHWALGLSCLQLTV